MDLLERYISAVKTFLPKAQQEDIAQELTANIQAQMEDREAELGRPLSEAEQESILQQLGHPMLVAGRYQPDPGGVAFGRQLIGRVLFPVYLRVLWIVLGCSCAIVLFVLIALAVSGNAPTFGGALNALVLQVVIEFVVVTGLFTVVDQTMPTIPWSAKDLPTRPVRVRAGQQIPRMDSLAQIVGILVFLFWLGFVLINPTLFFGSASALYRIGPIWYQLAIPTVLLMLVNIAQAVVNLVRPDWLRLHQGVRIGTDLVIIALLGVLIWNGHLVVLAHPTDRSTTLGSINTYVSYGLWVVLLGSVIVLLTDAWKLRRGEQKRAA